MGTHRIVAVLLGLLLDQQTKGYPENTQPHIIYIYIMLEFVDLLGCSTMFIGRCTTQLWADDLPYRHCSWYGYVCYVCFLVLSADLVLRMYQRLEAKTTVVWDLDFSSF